MANWRNVGIVVDGQPIRIGGINPWQHEWHATDQADVEIPHPSYPNQRHKMSIYESLMERRTSFSPQVNFPPASGDSTFPMTKST